MLRCVNPIARKGERDIFLPPITPAAAFRVPPAGRLWSPKKKRAGALLKGAGPHLVLAPFAGSRTC